MHIQKLFDLTGRVAVVTGGGRGLGKFVALGLAEAGADVVVASRKVQNCEQVAGAIRAIGRRALAVACDLEKVGDARGLIDRTVGAFGRVDIVVNNGGVTWGAPTLQFPLDRWDRVMAVNVRGSFVVAQQAAPHMIKQGGGKIINVASVMGLIGFPEDAQPAVAYNASKGALVTLTKDLAVKWARHNIQVNAIAPGFFKTDMMAWIDTESGKAAREIVLGAVPMARSGEEDDIKGLAVLLASQASNYMTGAVIGVDGGLLAR